MSDIQLNTIYNEDCLETMKRMPDGFVDAIISDPPYGMSYVSSRRKQKFEAIKDDDNLEWVQPFCDEAYRVLKDDTHIYLFCNDYAITDFRNALEASGFKVKRALVWVKNNHTSGDLLGDYANKTEFIVFAHKGRRLLNGGREPNVLQFKRVGNMQHPTQKPVDLVAYLVNKSTDEGDTVYDPFMGSGTTAKACQDLNRNFIGSEISKEYCDIAEERLKQAVLL